MNYWDEADVLGVDQLDELSLQMESEELVVEGDLKWIIWSDSNVLQMWNSNLGGLDLSIERKQRTFFISAILMHSLFVTHPRKDILEATVQ